MAVRTFADRAGRQSADACHSSPIDDGIGVHPLKRRLLFAQNDRRARVGHKKTVPPMSGTEDYGLCAPICSSDLRSSRWLNNDEQGLNAPSRFATRNQRG